MSEHHGDKTEQTVDTASDGGRVKKGQIARSPEVQTVFVMGAGGAGVCGS